MARVVVEEEEWDVGPAGLIGQKSNGWTIELYQMVEFDKDYYSTELTNRVIVDETEKMKREVKNLFDLIASKENVDHQKELDLFDQWDGENGFILHGEEELKVVITPVVLEAKLKWTL